MEAGRNMDQRTTHSDLRSRALEILKMKSSGTSDKLSDHEIARLIQELEVHQIELELQNEELQAAKSEALNRIRDDYEVLYENAPSGYFSLDRSCQIQKLNRECSRLLAKNCEHLVNSDFRFFVHQGSRAQVNEFIERVFETGRKQTCEAELETGRESPVYVLLEGHLSENGPECLATMVDITQRKLAEISLDESRKQYFQSDVNFQALMNATTETIWLMDMEGKILAVNPTGAARFRMKAGDLIGRMASDILTPELWRSRKEKMDEMARTGQVVYFTDERDGIIFSHSFYPVKEEKGAVSGFVVFSRDITLQHAAEVEKEMSVRFLQLINSVNDTEELIRSSVEFFYENLGCEGVSIRVRDGEDYPFLFAKGFSPEFLEQERYLCERDPDGKLVGEPGPGVMLECLCGDVLCERLNADKSLYTSNGTFVCNSTSLLEAAKDIESVNRIRGRCIREGFESMVLIPMKTGSEMIGLLQLVDKRTGYFSQGTVALYERLVSYLSVALSKFSVEEKLRESEARFRLALKNAPVSIALQDKDLQFTWAYNQRSVDPATVVHKTDKELFGEETARHLENIKRKVMETETATQEQLWIISNGRKMFLDLYIEPIFDKSGLVTGIGLATVDLTPFKKAEMALIESEQRFKAIASNTPDHILVQDENLRYTMVVNPQLGLTEEQMIGKTDYDFLTRDEADKLTFFKRDVMRSGQPMNAELPISGQDGKVEYFSGTYVPRMDSQGRVDGLIGYFRNVTEQKKAAAAIKQYSENLEALVQERTKAFQNTNEQLKAEIRERISIEETLRKQTAELEKYRYKLIDLVKERTADLESNNIKLAKEIVERRSMDRALKESERKFREIAQIVPGIIFQLRIRKDGSNYFSFVSTRAKELFGLPEDLNNMQSTLIEHIHPDDRTAFLVSFSDAVTGQEDWNFEGRIITGYGGIKWFHGLTSQSNIGEEIVLDGLMLDITNRKKTEEALLKSENKYKNLFNSMTEAFMICEMIFDRKGRPVNYKFLETNIAWEQQTGLNVGQLRGKTVKEVIPDIEQTWIDKYGETVLTGESGNFEEFNRSTNRYFRVHCFRVEGNTFAALFSDITHQKRVEEDLKVSITKYQVLFDSFPLGLTVTDHTGKIEESNSEAERLLGLSKEIQGKRSIDSKEWKVIRTDGTVMPQVEFASVRALQSGKLVENVEMGIVKEKGRITWLTVTAAPLPLKDLGVIITYWDITARKNSELALKESESRYKTLFNAMKEGFALHQVLYNEDGKPVDYRFIDINPAFEKLTGLKKNKVIGKTMTEVLPEEDPLWLEKYSSVVRTGIPVSFENYSPVLDRYYDVYSYCPAPDQFAVIFRDITEIKQREEGAKRKKSMSGKKQN